MHGYSLQLYKCIHCLRYFSTIAFKYTNTEGEGLRDFITCSGVGYTEETLLGAMSDKGSLAHLCCNASLRDWRPVQGTGAQYKGLEPSTRQHQYKGQYILSLFGTLINAKFELQWSGTTHHVSTVCLHNLSSHVMRSSKPSPIHAGSNQILEVAKRG